MGKNKIIYLYDFTINQSNRGCQALAYGCLSFVRQIIGNSETYEFVVPGYCFRKRDDEVYKVDSDDQILIVKRRFYKVTDLIFTSLLFKFHLGFMSNSQFAKDLRNLEWVANVNGGDGFSDIYSFKNFFILSWPSILAVFLRIKLIVMPQTIGPFKKKGILKIANYILKGANKVYIRDLMYAEELKKSGINFIKNYDVSFYMHPKPVNYKIEPNAVGINISGMAYYNRYRNLTGKFDNYKTLIINLIKTFKEQNIPVYLVPHTYNFQSPELDSDDLQASIDILTEIPDNKGVEVVNLDLTAPELKFIISKFSFFIGSRMHANFAAIYTKTPVFGLAYSYKFEGSFDLYGLKDNYASIAGISIKEADQVVSKVMDAYHSRKNLIFEL